MTNKDLADLIFPNLEHDVEYYEALYPERNLKEGEKVTRFAPSPTGYLHIGGFFQALIDYVLAKNSNGIFYLRNEDTDKAREVDTAVELIMKTLNQYGLVPDEYEYEGKIVGEYGPYIQSERKEIYHAYIKRLIEIGRAYPCFCTREELNEMRQKQEERKKRTGYYGSYAKCRKLSVEEQIEKIKANTPYVIRFRSNGDFDNKIVFEDLVKGRLSLSENDIDDVIMKSDNMLPTYHFAHVVDDHLMHTTHVVRGEEWLPSVTKHIEMFKAFGFKPPKYIHTPLIIKRDGDSVRKISKRKDPEASMSYYTEKGYPEEAVIEALMTIINSNYEEWHTSNPDKTFRDFTFSPKKMSSSGALFDLEKLNNISRDVISKMTKEELLERSLNWANKFDEELKELIEKDKEYYMNIINIERCQKKPRKDYETYSDIKNYIWYMYDELFIKEDKTYEFNGIDIEEVRNVLKTYFDKYYDASFDKDTWFNKMKEAAEEMGYCANMKEYKLNPDNYKGSIADFSMIIRVALTTKTTTPDLYEIMKLLGTDRIKERIALI
ncbi:glutamate--tRNA ligase [Clostridium sp. CAG:710]|nr:glutamate--tRNA ligase [Clostridium sp. CAG:710]